MAGDAKVVLVTGASSGIGAATAKLFAQRGFIVAVHGSNEERTRSVSSECHQLSKQESIPVIVDLNYSDSSELIIRMVINQFGRLDVLINNAGVYYKTHSADKSTYDLYRKTMLINCDSVVKLTMEAIPYLESSAGNIVFVSSVASTKPSASGYAYRMTKAAISSYAKCLAVDLAPKIRVNIVSPGPVATSLFDKAGISRETLDKTISPCILLGRVGEGEDIAKAIFYLASDEAAFINGAELFVDGGYLCKPQTVVTRQH